MNLTDLYNQIKSFSSSLFAGNVATATKQAGEILKSFGDILHLVGFESTAENAKLKQDCMDELDKCMIALSSVGAGENDAQEEGVCKIFPGDGSFLRALVELFIKFAPLILKK